MLQLHIQSIILIFLTFSFYLFTKIIKYNSLFDFYYETTMNCYFQDPTSIIPLNPPFLKSIKLCFNNKEHHKKMINLVNHMQLHTKDDVDLTMAPEFGSNVQLIYFKKYNLFMANPKIELEEDTIKIEMIDCEIIIGSN